MRILYLAHRIPFPPNKGDKLRAFRQIEHLSKRHEVWCASFVDRREDMRYLPALGSYCAEATAIPLGRRRSLLRGAAGLARGRTLTESFYDHPPMWSLLAEWRRRTSFDAVAAFSSSMAAYALWVPATRRVLDLCDLDSRKWLDYAASASPPVRWAYAAEGKRLARREMEWIETFDASVLVTEAEAQPLEGLVDPRRVHVITNGVLVPAVADEDGEVGPPVVGFVGAMDYRPNVDAVCWFAEACWPAVRAARPDAVFRIVGFSPARQVRRLTAIPRIEVVGGVEDVVSEVRRFRVSVAPLRIARGLQNKVLEAMAAAKPVVLTSKAAAGIGASDGEELVVADEVDALSAAVIRLLGDNDERRRIGSAARRFVETHRRWPEAMERFERLVTGVTGSRSATTLLMPSLASPAEKQRDVAGFPR